jgi:hypothetical protein
VNFSVCQANSGSMGEEVPTTTWKVENGPPGLDHSVGHLASSLWASRRGRQVN